MANVEVRQTSRQHISKLIMQAPSSCVVYTPTKLANAMTLALDLRPRQQILEPCMGSGALVRALARKGVLASRIRALDLDRKMSEADQHAKVIRGSDFLEWSDKTEERFDRIIANPPYLALSRLNEVLRTNALRVRDPFSGETLSLRGNYWHAFLCASLRLLKSDGGITFLLPAAWDYSNYAAALREELPKHFEQVNVHRSHTPLFKGVQEGSVVLVALGYRRDHKTFSRNEYFEVPELLKSLACADPLVVPSRSRENSQRREPHFQRLGDVIDVPIGAVCGDASYFLLNEDERKMHKLPASACIPVLSRSAHVRASNIDLRSWKRLRNNGERIWLFRPGYRHRKSKAVQRYLRLRPEAGGCDRTRYKVQSRKIWYQTPVSSQVDGFISGMSSIGPWICLSSMPGLNATNTLYIVRFKSARTLAEKSAIGLSLFTSTAQRVISRLGRRYADGLLKFEPGDLREIPVPVVMRQKGATAVYRKAARFMLAGKFSMAQQLADDWFRLP